MARKPAVNPPPNDDNGAEPEPITGLELFDDAGFADLTSYFYRVAGDGEREGPQHGYCYRALGILDPENVRRELGGGLYRVLVRRGRDMVARHLVRIAGAPRIAAAAPPDEPSPARDGVGELRAELRELRAALSNGGGARGGVGELRDLLSVLTAAGVFQPRPEPGALFGQLSDVFAKGIEAGRSGDGESGAAGVIRAAVEGITSIMQANPHAAAAVAPGAPPAAASAERVAAQETATVLIGTLLRGFHLGTDTEAIADAIESLVSAGDLARVRAMPDALAVNQVRAAARGLDVTTLARLDQYVIDVLRELRAPAETPED